MPITRSFRQPYYPAISKQPTSEEIARHLRLIYQALDNHDSAIVTLHGKIATTTPTSSPTAMNSLAQPAASGRVMVPVKKNGNQAKQP